MKRRRRDELFYDYKARRLMSQQLIKEKLKGELFWCSTKLVEVPPTIDNINIQYKTIKVNGTYVKQEK